MMHNLKKLCLNSTRIHVLHPSVGHLRSLETLSLDFNDLSDLPLTLQCCQNLTELSLISNQFECLPGLILKLNNITALRAAGNPLEKDPYHAVATTPRIALSSLQRLCESTILVNHIDYWKPGFLSPVLCSALDRLATTSALCNYCDQLCSKHGCHAHNNLQFSVEESVFPFHLHACNKRMCKMKLETECINVMEAAAGYEHSIRKKRCHIM